MVAAITWGLTPNPRITLEDRQILLGRQLGRDLCGKRRRL